MPLESGTARQYSSLCGLVLSMRISSRSHWIAAPAMNTLPSSAYCTSSPALAAMVVSRPCFERIASAPVFISMKPPVP